MGIRGVINIISIINGNFIAIITILNGNTYKGATLH